MDSRASALIVSIIALLMTQLMVAAPARAATPDASPVSAAVSKLGIWEGRWTYNERDYETPYSHAHTNSGTGDCNWAPNRGFMVCDYLNSSPGNGVPANDLGVFSYSSAAHTYARLGIFKDAKPFAEQITVNGNTWVTSSDIPYKGATLIYRNVHVFSQDGKQSRAITEISADKGKTWTTISRFTAVKVVP
jgi:hypothetical protein